MMGIYIKGMEMPTSCAMCPFENYGDCYGGKVKAIMDIDDYVSAGKRHPRCPLVPVLPHGDLVDQDAYRDEFMNSVYELCSDDPDNNRANAIIDLFDDAPTIISASEEATP